MKEIVDIEGADGRNAVVVAINPDGTIELTVWDTGADCSVTLSLQSARTLGEGLLKAISESESKNAVG